MDPAVKQFRPNPANTSVYKCVNTQTAQGNPFVSLAPEKPILNCQYNPNLIQYPEGGKKGAWWSPERWEIFNSLFCIWLDPELQLRCLFAAAPANGVRQRSNPRYGEGVTARSRGHLSFQSWFPKQKEGKSWRGCPDHFERSFKSVQSDKNPPFRCFYSPIESEERTHTLPLSACTSLWC